jgi:hypothetical protein
VPQMAVRQVQQVWLVRQRNESHSRQLGCRSFEDHRDAGHGVYLAIAVIRMGIPMDLGHMANRMEGMSLVCAVDNMAIADKVGMQGNQGDHQPSMAIACFAAQHMGVASEGLCHGEHPVCNQFDSAAGRRCSRAEVARSLYPFEAGVAIIRAVMKLNWKVLTIALAHTFNFAVSSSKCQPLGANTKHRRSR